MRPKRAPREERMQAKEAAERLGISQRMLRHYEKKACWRSPALRMVIATIAKPICAVLVASVTSSPRASPPVKSAP